MNLLLSQYCRFLLVACMLLAQSVAIAHDVDHSTVGHDEYCFVCIAVDQPLSVDHIQPKIQVSKQVFISWSVEFTVYTRQNFLIPHSRAPPLLS